MGVIRRKAVYRVKNKLGNTVGFILDDLNFYNSFYVQSNIENISNLQVIKSGVIKCSKGKLPEISLRQNNDYLCSIRHRGTHFKRICQDQMLSWKHKNHHKILKVDGATQIGKTSEVKDFCYNHYDQIIYVDILNDQNKFVNSIRSLGINKAQLSIYCRNNNLPDFIDDAQTVLIIDNIQSSSIIYSSIRELRNNLNCDIIIITNYIHQVINSKHIQPNDIIETVKVEQLQFKEFCGVFNCDELLMNISLFGGSQQDSYEKLYKLYRLYRQIGGYPEVIARYLCTGKIEECMECLGDLVNRFIQSIYTVNKDSSIKNYLKDQLDIVIKSSLNKGQQLSYQNEVGVILNWLEHCGMIVKQVLYFTDCGIANYMAQNSMSSKYSINKLLTYTFIMCELNRSDKGHTISKVEQCRDKQGLDLIITDKTQSTVGIKVCTQKDSYKSIIKQIQNGSIDRGILAVITNGGHSDNFDTIPIFALGCRYPYKD